MSPPTFWDFLSRPNDELVAMGVSRRDIVARRFTATGHVRPIESKWIASVGMWGRTHSLDEIAERVGVERAAVKDYAKASGLRVATRSCRRTHAELAILLWADRAHSPEESSETFGVYPAERRVLCAAAQVLIDGVEGGIETVMRWKLPELDARFEALNINLRPPPHLLPPHARTQTEHDQLAALHLKRLEAP